MLKIEQVLPNFQETHQLGTQQPTLFGHSSSNITTTATGGTLTAAQVAGGYIAFNGATVSGLTATLPTGTLLGAQLGAVKGDIFELYIDNTAGTLGSTVTMAVAVNGIKSDAASGGSFGTLTVATGPTGVGRFTLMFTSPTAYAFSRTA